MEIYLSWCFVRWDSKISRICRRVMRSFLVRSASNMNSSISTVDRRISSVLSVLPSASWSCFQISKKDLQRNR